jgi:hypothetical protein
VKVFARRASEVQDTSATKGYLRLVLGLFASGSAVAVAASDKTFGHDTSELLLLTSLVFAYVVARRTSPALRVYVVVFALWFLFPPLLGLDSGLPELSQAWALAALWLLAWTAGQLLLGGTGRAEPKSHHQEIISASGATFGLVAIGLVALGIQAFAIRHSGSSYGLQLQGISNTSLSGTFATLAGPALVAALIVSWNASTRRLRKFLAVLIMIEATLSAFSGFRGAAILYLLSATVSFVVVHPPSSSRNRNALVGGVLAAILIGVPLIFVASEVRQNAAAAVGITNNGLTLASLPREVANRFDEVPNLAAALQPLTPTAQAAVAMSHQAEIFIPRELWPSKPIFNYGEQVSSAIYGNPASYNTSSTITWLGDLYLNGGVWMILASGVGFGALVCQALRRSTQAGPLMVIVIVLLITALFNAESPLVLAIAGFLKSFLILALVCLVARPLREIFRLT